MKKFAILMFISILFSFCTKQADDLVQPKPESKSITYLHHYYNGGTVLIKTDTALHRHGVKGEDLKRFEGYLKMTSFCDGTNDKLELRIEKDCVPGTHETISQ